MGMGAYRRGRNRIHGEYPTQGPEPARHAPAAPAATPDRGGPEDPVRDGHPRVEPSPGGAEGRPRGCRDLRECRHGDDAAEEGEGRRFPHREGGEPGAPGKVPREAGEGDAGEIRAALHRHQGVPGPEEAGSADGGIRTFLSYEFWKNGEGPFPSSLPDPVEQVDGIHHGLHRGDDDVVTGPARVEDLAALVLEGHQDMADGLGSP